MKISLAPMEGITNFIFRRVYLKHFGGIDVSYTPFITANQTHSYKKKEKLEIDPYDDKLIPQILTNNPEAFVWAAKNIAAMGYKEINLNLGCPSPTVTSHGRGAGMLTDLDRLKAFFEVVFKTEDLPEISVKTRVGIEDPAEAAPIAKLYSQYPISHIIIHSRLLKDLYKGSVRLDCFREFYDLFPAEKLVFNGDINTADDAEAVIKQFPGITEIMIGRGLLKDPFLPEEIKAENGITCEPGRIAAFLSELWDEYAAYLSGEKDVLFKMKEIWSYLAAGCPDGEKVLKEIRKAQTPEAYRRAIKNIYA